MATWNTMTRRGQNFAENERRLAVGPLIRLVFPGETVCSSGTWEYRTPVHHFYILSLRKCKLNAHLSTQAGHFFNTTNLSRSVCIYLIQPSCLDAALSATVATLLYSYCTHSNRQPHTQCTLWDCSLSLNF